MSKSMLNHSLVKLHYKVHKLDPTIIGVNLNILIVLVNRHSDTF